MSALTSPAAAGATAVPTPAQLAKGALRRVAADRLEPTPENFRKAYEAEAAALGAALPEPRPAPAAPPPAAGTDDGPAWADLIGRLARGLERSHRQWTAARRKDSLQRVLGGSRHSGARLLGRLQQLVQAWDTDQPEESLSAGADGASTGAAAGAVPVVQAPPTDAALAIPGAAEGQQPVPSSVEGGPTAADAPQAPTQTTSPIAETAAAQALTDVNAALACALIGDDAPSQDARAAVATAIDRVLHASCAPPLPAPVAEELTEACQQARRVIEHRHHLLDQMVDLCRTLTDSLVDVAEDDSWVQGQCLAMRAELDDGLNHRGTRRMQQLLEDTRQRQRTLRQEREAARQALKQLIHQMLGEIAELGSTTGRFQDKLVGYADTIGQADTLERLTGVVREMVEESRAVHDVVSQTRERLHTEHTRATELGERVQRLEAEIRKLSDEVSTDPLTQIANRRGLMTAFEAERSRVERQGQPLAIGLLDVDNFKKLNDTLGHNTGDEALKFLARRVGESLRPSDALARYGGEEFVVLMPDTDVEEGQRVLTRLQRQLSAEFFTQDEHKVFITFSAGVTQYRSTEAIEAALDRADVALYEAKRTGKNKTCIG